MTTPSVIQERAIPSGELLRQEPNTPENTAPGPAVHVPEGLKLLGNSEDERWAVVAPAKPDEADRWLSLWDVAAGKRVEELKGVALPLPNYVKASPDGRLMAYVDSETGETIKVYDWTQKRFLCTVPIGGRGVTDDLKQQAGFSPDGTLLAFSGSVNKERALLLYDVEHGEPAGVLTSGNRLVNSSVWSRDGSWLITAGQAMNGLPHGGNLAHTHLQFNEVLYPTPTYHAGGAERSLCFLRDGTELAAGRSLWDVTPGEKRTTLKPKVGALPEGALLLAVDTGAWALQPNLWRDDDVVFTLRRLDAEEPVVAFKHPGFTDPALRKDGAMPVPRLCNAAMTPDGARLLCLFYLDYPGLTHESPTRTWSLESVGPAAGRARRRLERGKLR